MNNKNYQEDLSHIRSMMEKSSRFISLSGLSGVFSGLFALAGAIYVYMIFKKEGIEYFDGLDKEYHGDLIFRLLRLAIVILIAAISSGIFFTVRKSYKNNLPIWTSSTKQLLVNFAIPLIAGGVFCIGLLFHNFYVLLSPSTLIFYGLALINAGKYTYSDIQYLGILEVILGLLSLFFLGWGLVFWAIGFGVLHIVYGIVMYKKYQ